MFSTPPCNILKAARTPTTMDSLEAHVWSSERPESLTKKAEGVLFLMFRNNVMYSRLYRNRGYWDEVQEQPFYFYTPGKENITDIRVYYPDTIHMFRYKHIGKQQNGQHFVTRYWGKEHMQHLKHKHTSQSQRDYKQLKRLRRDGLSPFARAFDILTLNDSLLYIHVNNDYREQSSYKTSLHATTSPFPWDENLKHFDYPIQEDARGAISPADIKRRKTVKKKKR